MKTLVMLHQGTVENYYKYYKPAEIIELHERFRSGTDIHYYGS